MGDVNRAACDDTPIFNHELNVQDVLVADING